MCSHLRIRLLSLCHVICRLQSTSSHLRDYLLRSTTDHRFSPSRVFDSPQGHLQHESDEVYVTSPPCNDTPHVDLGDIDETHGDDNDYNTWDDVWKESIPTPQDTQFERSEKSHQSAKLVSRKPVVGDWKPVVGDWKPVCQTGFRLVLGTSLPDWFPTGFGNQSGRTSFRDWFRKPVRPDWFQKSVRRQ
nr:uncharacterized protein LOC109180081 [Ipomoea batatas]